MTDLGPAFEGVDPTELDELAAAGWGEGDHEDAHVPDDLLELHVALELVEAGVL